MASIYQWSDPPEIEGVTEYRQDRLTYDQWLYSDYVADMWRRKAYYDERQVAVNQNGRNTALEAHGEDYLDVTPEQWRYMHSGPGWEDICAMLPDATKESVVKFFGINLTSVIINNRQVVYSLPVKSRSVRVDGEVDEETSKKYRRITRAATMDLKADQLCKWSGLFTTVFQHVDYDEKNKRIKLQNLEPWRVLAFESEDHSTDLQDEGVMVCVMLQSEDLTTLHRRQDKVVWQVWWKDRYWYETDPAQPYKDRDCTEEGTNENPYKDKHGRPVKPIQVVKDVISDQIYERGSDLLIQQNQVIDRQLTAGNYTVEYQGFAVPVVTGADPEEMEANPHSPAAPVILRDPAANYRYVNPNARPSEFLSSVRAAARTVARLYAVDPELVDSDSKVQSGVSRAQARIALIERRKKEFPKWERYEREAYWLMSIVWNTFNPPAAQLHEIDRFVSGDLSRPEEEVLVEYAPVSLSTDVLTDALASKHMLDLNLTTRPELLAVMKDIDLDAAKEAAQNIKEYNEKDRGFQLLTPRPGKRGPEPDRPDASGQGLERIGANGNRPHSADDDRTKVLGQGTPMGAGNVSVDDG